MTSNEKSCNKENFAMRKLGSFMGWTIVDKGTGYGPSKWSAESGALVQSSNIGSGSQLGTFALY